jgi:hypothetical protein
MASENRFWHLSAKSSEWVLAFNRSIAGQLLIAVGTAIAGCPPHRSGRALVSASGSYLG